MKAAFCILATIALLEGCGVPISNYASISTHTVRVAPDKDADVVWVQQLRNNDFVLMRCHNAPEGPLCVRVKTP